MVRFPNIVCSALAIALVLPGAAHAQQPDQGVGDSHEALPGLARVGTAGPMKLGASLSASASFGVLGETIGTNDSHQRLGGELSATLRLHRAVAFGVRFDGRYDSHSDDGGSDSGFVGDPRLLVRVSDALGDKLALGGQLTVWAPGSDAPSVVFDAISVDAVVLATVRPSAAPLTLTANVGFRLDQSANSVDDPGSLSLPDRLALGVSDFNAVLAGLGVSYRAGQVEVLGEASLDLLVGDGAPGFSESPLNVTAGARYHINDALQAQLLADVSLASKPTVNEMSALIPVRPTFAAMAGLHYQFGGKKDDGRLVVDDDKVDDKAPPPPKAEPATVVVTVASGGIPVAGADVTVTAGDSSPDPGATDGTGKTTIEGLEVGKDGGKGSITVKLDGYNDKTVAVDLSPGKTAEVAIELDRILPPGEIKGTVLDYATARPVRATVTVVPGDIRVTADASGRFSIKVAPGKYQVKIEAPGFKPKLRDVVVEEGGVAIVPSELRK